MKVPGDVKLHIKEKLKMKMTHFLDKMKQNSSNSRTREDKKQTCFFILKFYFKSLFSILKELHASLITMSKKKFSFPAFHESNLTDFGMRKTNMTKANCYSN